MYRSAILAVLAVLCTVRLGAGEATLEDRIKDATCALYVEQILGFHYEAPVFEKGLYEANEVGQLATAGDRTFRAVALGEEAGHVVFFTLRSFVDPFYPNPAIQGITKPIHDRQNEEVSFQGTKTDDAMRQELIRYARFQLNWYEDLGGGQSKLSRKVDCVTIADDQPPKDHSSYWTKKEVYKGGTYTRPHARKSVADHFTMQSWAESKASIRWFEDHDVVLFYVPKACFPTGDLAKPPPTLGLKNPTVAVDLALRRSTSLFGFRFNLMGQETMDAIAAYTPPDSAGSGIAKLIKVVGLALDTYTFRMFTKVDKALDQAIPDIGKVDDLNEIWSAFQKIDEETIRRIVNHMAEAVETVTPGVLPKKDD